MGKVGQDSRIAIKAAFMVFSGLLSSTTIAQTMENKLDNPWYNTIKFSVAVGPNWLHTTDTTLRISPYETDNILVNSISNHGAWKAGVGCYLFDNSFSARKYFNHLLFEINVYQISASINGSVEQYQLPQFNNYSYQGPVTSTRLMFDFKPYLFTYQQVSPYFILGVGPAWNQMSYTEQVSGTGVPTNSNLILDNHTTAQLAGDLGVGLSVQLSKQWSLMGEYVYGVIGNASPANASSNNVLLENGPNFTTHTQSLLFGLSLTL